MKYISIFFIIFLFSCNSSDSPQPQQTPKEPFEIHCSQPLPVFTLGRDSNPTKVQEKALCECIWGSLGSWEREVSEKIAQGKESEVSKMQIQAFISRFGKAIEKCGGMKQ